MPARPLLCVKRMPEAVLTSVNLIGGGGGVWARAQAPVRRMRTRACRNSARTPLIPHLPDVELTV